MTHRKLSVVLYCMASLATLLPLGLRAQDLVLPSEGLIFLQGSRPTAELSIRETSEGIVVLNPLLFESLTQGEMPLSPQGLPRGLVRYQLGTVDGEAFLVSISAPTGILEDPNLIRTLDQRGDIILEGLRDMVSYRIQKCNGAKRCTRVCTGRDGRPYCCEYTCQKD